MPVRNVLNVDTVDRFVDRLAAQSESPAVAQWLRRTARRWILTDHSRYAHVAIDRASSRVAFVDPGWPAKGDRVLLESNADSLPGWCRDALASGRAVVVLHLDAGLEKRLRRIAAYLEGVCEGRPTLGRLSFADAEKGMRAARRARWAARRAHEGVQVYRGAEGVEIVRLKSADTLAEEGRRMNHCVGTYATDVAQGLCEIYSLRDGSGESRATVEVIDGDRVVQVKGPHNGSVQPALRRDLRSFFRSRGYKLRGDVENVALPVTMSLRASDFAAILETRDGGAALAAHRYPAADALSRADTLGLVWWLCKRGDDLPPAALRAVHDLLLPHPEAPVRLRRVGRLYVYDVAIPLVRAEAAVTWLSLARRGVFDDVPGAAKRYALLRSVTERCLAALALQPPGPLYLLGQDDNDEVEFRGGWAAPAELLRESRFDVAPALRRRHGELRRLVNQRKARRVGRRSAPSESHRYLRRLLDGDQDEMVV